MKQFYEDSINHRKEHKCGGFPFESADFLTKIATALKPENVLEIGTAIGYSSTALALGYPGSIVTTLDLYDEHIEIAKMYWEKFEVIDQIKAHVEPAEEFITKTNVNYDLIFYDGYAPDVKLASHLYDSLAENGLLVSTNLELPAREMTGDAFIAELKNLGLITRRIGDIAFSSNDQEAVNQAEEIWNEEKNLTA